MSIKDKLKLHVESPAGKSTSELVDEAIGSGSGGSGDILVVHAEYAYDSSLGYVTGSFVDSSYNDIMEAMRNGKVVIGQFSDSKHPEREPDSMIARLNSDDIYFSYVFGMPSVSSGNYLTSLIMMSYVCTPDNNIRYYSATKNLT